MSARGSRSGRGEKVIAVLYKVCECGGDGLGRVCTFGGAATQSHSTIKEVWLVGVQSLRGLRTPVLIKPIPCGQEMLGWALWVCGR